MCLPPNGQLCDILDEFSATSHFLPPPASYKNSTVLSRARANLLTAGLWCRGAGLQMDFITRHYFCSFTLAIHFTQRVKILAPVKSLGPVPVGREPGFPPALRMPYHKWQFHSAASIATGNPLPLQSCFKPGKATVAVFCSILLRLSAVRSLKVMSWALSWFPTLPCAVQSNLSPFIPTEWPREMTAWAPATIGSFHFAQVFLGFGHGSHLPKITFLSDLAFSGKTISNSGWWHINEEVIRLQWNCLFLYRCYLSKPTKECTNCKMPCFGGDFSVISKFQSMLFVLAKNLIFSVLCLGLHTNLLRNLLFLTVVPLQACITPSPDGHS